MLCLIDASRSLARAYQERLLAAHVACESAETSELFGRQFDGVLSWGLMFLLRASAQEAVIRRVSLGLAVYRTVLADAGLVLAHQHEDDGENHYYDAIKAISSPASQQALV